MSGTGVAHKSSSASESIAALALFEGCSRRELRVVARIGTRISVPAGRRVLVAGRQGREFVLVLAGSARCLVGERPVALFGAGSFFGEVAALTGGTRTATVVAVEDMELLVLERHELEALLVAVPGVALRMAREMARRIRVADELAVA